jgi:hypothetical protein
MLVGGLVAAFIYAIKVVGPKVAPEGQVISKFQMRMFIVMIALLWLASDWPMHERPSPRSGKPKWLGSVSHPKNYTHA